ncbi:hypothetical protein OJAV_G00172360 [Oryzias javanicus]|uniref:26S proteasome non-ATPase regulatory subunit 5 n=1 Tax=Oryzias javanicus TaxID=123683 RepID=A0A437CGT8_ORYJA|nr:hypothetical protein OJAV_G00172360 [Oryzias javanicus]
MVAGLSGSRGGPDSHLQRLVQIRKLYLRRKEQADLGNQLGVKACRSVPLRVSNLLICIEAPNIRIEAPSHSDACKAGCSKIRQVSIPIYRYIGYRNRCKRSRHKHDCMSINYPLSSISFCELTGDNVLIRATAIEMRGGDRPLLLSLPSRFGEILWKPGHYGQQVCESYPVFQSKVFEMALDTDPAMIGVALDTLGLLGSTVEGKQVLQKTGEKFKAVLARMSQLASSGATELRVRSLDAISQLLTLMPEQQTEDLLALTESWFHLLSKQPMEMICSISTQPFPELHCAALQIFAAVATQPWGQRLMINTLGFMEFILDRSTGQTKEAKDSKFELVGSLAGSSTAAETLGSQHYLRLKTYLREGPSYISAVASVSTEGAD